MNYPLYNNTIYPQYTRQTTVIAPTSSIANRAAAAGVGRLQTPSLTSLTSTTSTTSMLTTSSGGRADSVLGSTTIVGGYSTPPLIDLENAGPDDGREDGPLRGDAVAKQPLAFDAGAGITPTDKLRALLRQMEGEVRATQPELQGGLRTAPTTLRQSVPESFDTSSRPVPTSALSPQAEDTEDEYSPPTPPPRITNPYIYSRRAIERRDVSSSRSRSPSPPRRLPSRAIALRAAAEAASAVPEPRPSNAETLTPLQSFIASHPDPFPEPSKPHSGQQPRPPSPVTLPRKHKARPYHEERAAYVNGREHVDRPEGGMEDSEVYGDDYDPEEEQMSPPRRRRLTRREFVDTPPDTSAAFAAGLSDEDRYELDLEEDNTAPWQDEDTMDSLDSGSGRRQRLVTAAALSHSRSRDYITHTTTNTHSFATATSMRPSVASGEMSLPQAPDPESFDEKDVPGMRRRSQIQRPFLRDSIESFKRSPTAYMEARSHYTHDPEESTRYDTARDSARLDALRYSGHTESHSPREISSTLSARYVRALDETPPNHDAAATSPAHHRAPSRKIANEPSRNEEERDVTPERQTLSPHQSLRTSMRTLAKASKARDPSTSPLEDWEAQSAVPQSQHISVIRAARTSIRTSRPSPPNPDSVRWSPQVRSFESDFHNSEAAEEDASWAPEEQEHSRPVRVRRSPQTQRHVQRTPPREEELQDASPQSLLSTDAALPESSTTPELTPATHTRQTFPPPQCTPPKTLTAGQHTPPKAGGRAEMLPSTPERAPQSTSPDSTPPTHLTPAPSARPSVEKLSTPLLSTATPAHLRGMKTPRLPGAWGTPPPPRPAGAGSVASTPASPPHRPQQQPGDLSAIPTPKPPGAWGTPGARVTSIGLLSSAPSTPSPAPNLTLAGMPTPRPPGAWQKTPAPQRFPHQRSIPARFSSLRNEVLPDSSVSSAGSSEVSFHRLRSPKRSPTNELPSPTGERKPALLTSVIRSPQRSPVWSPPARATVPSSPASPATPSKGPTTPTCGSRAALLDDSFDPDASWMGRLHRLVMSPVRAPRPSTILKDAQQALDLASQESAVAWTKVENAQRAWLDALAAVPPEQEQRVPVVAVVKKGWSWASFLFWITIELLLIWVVFRVTIEYATSSSMLSRLDPWNPQSASYVPDVRLPAGLQAFATRPTAPSNLFDFLDMLGIGGRSGSDTENGGGSRVWRPPT